MSQANLATDRQATKSELISHTEDILSELGLDVCGAATIPKQASLLKPVPGKLASRLRAILQEHYPDGIYSHQATGLEQFLSNKNVCLATATASGKSLVFMTAAAHVLLTDPNAKILALYPARALIQDQYNKWRDFLQGLGLTSTIIDGGVPVRDRSPLLQQHQIVLMTPDVVQAWLLAKLDDPAIAQFCKKLKILILDEVHVYDGVFGTNMAYLLRRLQAVTSIQNIVASTATIGQPKDVLTQLTGREFYTLGPEDDGAGSPGRTLYCVRNTGARGFETGSKLLRKLSEGGQARFIAFADSRKMVEQLAASLFRRVAAAKSEGQTASDPDDSNDVNDQESHSGGDEPRVLPYRAGFEEQDRSRIQEALLSGNLGGVVSTSALELGLDIGDLDIVILLGVPPTMKAFWQRVGRSGRKQHGVCLLLDDVGVISEDQAAFERFLKKPLEASWFYLNNRYIQYANVLCAATEASVGHVNKQAYESLPAGFRDLLDNEINQTGTTPDDLYPLKQRALESPHREFPVRSGIEQSFQVEAHDQFKLGNLTFSQAMREAYPGAVYYYIARPYRIYTFDRRRSIIKAKREARYTTKPVMQSMVFPKFRDGVMQLWTNSTGFVAEAELQVTERILGFVERRGSAKFTHTYDALSEFSQRPIQRYFETTGVCWYFDNKDLVQSRVALPVLDAFCGEFGVQSRDIGDGAFHSELAPNGRAKCQGYCIYDAAHGSLRLTSQLAQNFESVCEIALKTTKLIDAENHEVIDILELLVETAKGLQEARSGHGESAPVDEEWVTVVAPECKALLRIGTANEVEEVTVKGHRYTPKGLMYELVPKFPDKLWMVESRSIVPIPETSHLVRFNLNTGEIQ